MHKVQKVRRVPKDPLEERDQPDQLGELDHRVQKDKKGEQAGITSIANFADNRVLTASTTTAINGESNLTFDGTNLVVVGSGTVGADHFVFTDYGGPALQMNDSSFTNAAVHDVLYTAYQTNLGDYISLKAAGNSTSGHGIIGIADNGIYFGRSNVETSAHQCLTVTAPSTELTTGILMLMVWRLTALSHGDGGTNGVINIKASSNGYIQQNGNTRLTINSSGITSGSNVYTSVSGTFRNYGVLGAPLQDWTGNGFYCLKYCRRNSNDNFIDR